MTKFIFIILLSTIWFNNLVNASSQTLKSAADLLYIGLIVHAYGDVYHNNDAWKPLTYHTLATLGSGYMLKGLINTKRPDYKYGDHKDSFPSGHTFAAFIAPTYIHRKYGFKKAIPTYILASAVGYSRVNLRRHYVHDVIGGAVLAYISSLLFIKPSLDNTVAANITLNSASFIATFRF